MLNTYLTNQPSVFLNRKTPYIPSFNGYTPLKFTFTAIIHQTMYTTKQANQLFTLLKYASFQKIIVHLQLLYYKSAP